MDAVHELTLITTMTTLLYAACKGRKEPDTIPLPRVTWEHSHG